MKKIIFLALISSSAFALTGDVTHDYQIEQQLEQTNVREPQSEKIDQKKLQEIREKHKKYWKSRKGPNKEQ